jgi:hypothetical protein
MTNDNLSARIRHRHPSNYAPRLLADLPRQEDKMMMKSNGTSTQ